MKSKSSSSSAKVLMHLAGSRNIAMLDRHAALGRPILCRNAMGDHGVHTAASRGYRDVVEWFLDHGMDVNVLGREEFSFGLVAACFGHFDILHLFLERGGDLQTLNYFGMNILQRNIFFGESEADVLAMINDVEYSRLLTANTSDFGFQVCHFAAHFGCLNILRALVAAGVDVDVPSTRHDLTPFLLAAQCGHLDVLKYLYSIGVNVNARTFFHENAAHFVAALGDVELLCWLDSISVDLRAETRDNQSILTCAVEANQYECCRWLLEEGGYHHLLDDYPGQDLICAFRTQNLPIAKLLVSRGARHRNPMALACSCFHTGLLDFCEGLGAVPASSSFIALRHQDFDAFEWLVSHSYVSWVETAFKFSEVTFPVDFEALQERGFDFHILNVKGQTLWFGGSSPVFFHFLIEEGVDPNIVDVGGNCAWALSSAEWKKQILIIIGACPLLDRSFLEYMQGEIETIDVLPDCVDIWNINTDVTTAARLRLLAINAILDRAESLIVNINQKYPLVLWAAAIVVEHGVEILREFGFAVGFDELLVTLEEKRFTYLANRCREEKIRSMTSSGHVLLL